MEDRQPDNSRRSSGTFKRLFSKSEKRASLRTPPDSRGSPIPATIPEGNEPQSPVNWTDSFYPVTTALEPGNSFSNIGTPISAPLKATCDAIQALVKTILEMRQSNEEFQDLIDKLSEHLTFLEEQTNISSSHDYVMESQLHVKLRKYVLELQEIGHKLEELRGGDKGGIKKTIKKIATSRSTQDSLKANMQKVDDSFRRLTIAITALIQAQTEEMVARQAFHSAISKLPDTFPIRRHDRCLKGTRTAVLDEIRSWAVDPKSKPVFALVDQAGTGKSTIAASMVDEWSKSWRMGAQFHFTKPAIVTAESLATTLCRGIAERIPEIRGRITTAINAHSEFMHDPISAQLEWLVFTPLREERDELVATLHAIRKEKVEKGAMEAPEERPRSKRGDSNVQEAERVYLKAVEALHDRPLDQEELKALEESYIAYLAALEEVVIAALDNPPIIVIDAFNECSIEDRAVVLRSILRPLSHPYPFKVFLTSRPEQDIITRIEKSVNLIRRSEHSLLSKSNASDVSIYAEKYLQDVLNPVQLTQFVKRANGLFIWASTAREFLNVTKPLVMGRFSLLLKPILRGSPLSALYSEILTAAASKHAYEIVLLKKILQVVAVSREPLKLSAMDEILGLSSELGGSTASTIVASFRSVLSDGAHSEPVQVLHPTFLEYLQSDSQPETFRFSLDAAHALLASGCLATLNEQLQYDNCGVARPGAPTPLNSEVENLKGRIRKKTTSGLRYAAIHGLWHVAPLSTTNKATSRLQVVFQKRLLYWIELMSLLGKVHPFLHSVQALKARIQDAQGEEGDNSEERKEIQKKLRVCRQWCDEILRMLQPFQGAVEESAMQVYYSALAFVPSTSLIYEHYHKRYDPSIPKVLRGTWALTPQSIVLAGHIRPIKCIAYSPDGRRIASGSSDHTAWLWDAETGAAIGGPLRGHTESVDCVSFSPGGRMLASGSGDSSIRLWDVESGTPLGEPLQGHMSGIIALAFSPDSRHLASTSGDGTVRLWDTETWAEIGEPLRSESDLIDHLAFLPSGKLFAYGSGAISPSGDIGVIWDIETAIAASGPRKVHTEPPNYLVFSPDSKRLASASNSNNLSLFDIENEEITGKPLRIPNSWARCVTFSIDGKQIAFGDGSDESIVRLWDAETGFAIGEPLRGHTERITCLAFSPNGNRLASGSEDRTIRLWSTEVWAEAEGLIGDHISSVKFLVVSPEGRRLASASDDDTIRLWDVETGMAVGFPLRGHSSRIKCLVFSPNGRILASGSEDRTVCLWNAETGAPFGNPLRGHTSQVSSLAFSPDGSLIASGSRFFLGESTVHVWDIETGAAMGVPLRGHTGWINCLAFSPDGKRLASGSEDSTIRLWDAKTLVAVGKPLKGHTETVKCLSFSPDSKMLVSGSASSLPAGNTLCFWDPENGSTIRPPLVHGTYIESCYFHSFDGVLFLIVNNSSIYNMSTNPTTRYPSLDELFTMPTVPPLPNLLLRDDMWWTYVLTKKHRLRFHIPNNFSPSAFCIHQGTVFYGGFEGSVKIINCSHLL
ncbi:WD40 repeat-like protein [Serendipita vermifera]|nr:WD40 repeat-like protein [Serendipita vermifera]